jgi:hypothetical protein
VSVRVLAWLAAASAAAAAILMWFNVDGFAAALDETAVRRMTAGAAATGATAIVLLGLAAAHFSFGRRGSRVGAALPLSRCSDRWPCRSPRVGPASPSRRLRRSPRGEPTTRRRDRGS